jgi:hypothetical protein
MPGGLQFVLILPDGSKSLVPAAWTDFKTVSSASPESPLIGALNDLLRLRGLVDALLQRMPQLPVTSGAGQESHAATDFKTSPKSPFRRRSYGSSSTTSKDAM